MRAQGAVRTVAGMPPQLVSAARATTVVSLVALCVTVMLWWGWVALMCVAASAVAGTGALEVARRRLERVEAPGEPAVATGTR